MSETVAMDGPCRCHRTLALIVATHAGHCCFLPATQDCHQAEVAAWEAEKVLEALTGGGVEP